MNEPLEPMDEDLGLALGALRAGEDVPSGAEERLLARIQQSASTSPSPSRPVPQAPAATPTGAPWWMVPTAFVLGGALGALAWEARTPPPVRETLVREVIVEVFPDAGTDASPPGPDAGATLELNTDLNTEPSPASDEAAESAAVTRDAERSLLMRAQVALTRSLPSDGLSALSQHRARFPHGQLVEEREALWVQALAASGDSRASSAAASFLQRYPESIFREAVELLR